MEKFELKPSSYIKGFIDKIVSKLNELVEAINGVSGRVLPVVSSADNGKFLTVESGEWQATELETWTTGGDY